MSLKQIQEEISIRAGRKAIWQVLTDDGYLRIWYRCFGEGLRAETAGWREGSKAVFCDSSNNGIIGTIKENVPEQRLCIVYTGLLSGGREDYTSGGALKIKGGAESYTLSGDGAHTQLRITSDMEEAHYEYMQAAWTRALEKIKELAESPGSKATPAAEGSH